MPRIALVQQGDPTDPTSWSGVPAHLAGGLEAAGCTVVPIRALFPGARRLAWLLRVSWTDQASGRFFAAACGAAANRKLRRVEVDGVVMLGSGYELSCSPPVATFDDMTLALALRQGSPVYDSIDPSGRRRWLERQRRIYEASRGCCTTSSWVAASISDDYGIPAEKVHVIGFGHNVDAGQVERDWSIPHYLWVGADWERKRGAATVEAFATVRQRHPDATLDLVGAHPPIEADGVTGHGRLPFDSEEGQRKYRELLRRATCFLMPSTYEPFGIAYIDAGAAGVPSIGTAVGGAVDAIGEGGVVVDPSADGILAEEMLKLADPERARELGALANRNSLQFSWQAVAERLLRALRPRGIDLDALAPFLEHQPVRVDLDDGA